MIKSRSCRSCDFYRGDLEDPHDDDLPEDYPSGRCHRFPPTTFIPQRGHEYLANMDARNWFMPYVFASTFCGEWKRNSEDEQAGEGAE